MNDAMLTTIDAPVDSAGRIVLPRAVRESLGLRAGMRLRMRVLAGRLEMTVAEDQPPAATSASGRRILSTLAAAPGAEPSDARAAVRAEREAQARRRR
jgi:AbrB family looped-hinge helix DNA binding protein